MGIVSWIKNKYYDHRLSKADKLVEDRKLDKASLIYESLLGKQPLACAHLVKMLVNNASSVKDKLDVFTSIIDLREYVNDESQKDYDASLSTHVASMESLAAKCFNNRAYYDAVELINAIRDFRRSQSYCDTVNRYNAYLAFDRSQHRPLSKDIFSGTVSHLAQISSVPVSDIKEFLKILENQNRFARAVKLLIQLQSAGNWVKDFIFRYTVEIINGKDSELKNIKSISSFCDDGIIAKDIALYLAKKANQCATNKDYRSAVVFDNFASEYLSGNNVFNFDRCQHILVELSSRADVKEIKALRDFALSLKLTIAQIDWLDNYINRIAVATIPTKAIAICRLYIKDPKFDKVYLEKALSLAKAGESLNTSELRDVIGYQANVDSLPDILAAFVPYIPIYEQEFLDSAIAKIKKEKREDLLDKYWKIKSHTQFITSLLSKEFENWKGFASHIAKHNSIYLSTVSFKDTFCVAINGNNDLEFTLTTIESLLQKGVGVKEFYVKVILDNSTKATTTNESLVLINRGLNCLVHDKLLAAKKRFISKLIKSGEFDKAENEISTILCLDEEAPTLLAELYYTISQNNRDSASEQEWIYKVLDVNEHHKLLNRFDISLNQSLERLLQLSHQLYSNNKKDKADEIARRISKYYSYWIPLYSWLRSQDLASDATLNIALRHDANAIEEISRNCPNCKDYISEEFISLWSRYVENTVKKAHSQPKDKAITSLCALRSVVGSFAPLPFGQEKINEITNLVIKLKWSLGCEYEHDLSFEDAISLYEEITSEDVLSYVNRAELRALICYLKSNNVNESIESRIGKALELRSYQALREDLAYRFACYLLQSTRPSDAENILRSYLPDEKTLLDMCENIYLKEAENKLAEFNQKIKTINEDKMSLDEAIEFKQSIHDFKKQITAKLTDLGRNFGRFVPMVESYILRKMFEEEAYVDLLNKLMQENPNYVENDIDFRNIAIASLGIIESDEKDKPTLMRAIAIILTAIYKDKLFVQSLDYTSWDDKYTFSLDGSLGQTNYDDYDDLPDNVNFDTPVENENIAIRDVQNSLLTRVESSVRKNHPELEEFCASEKDALDRLIGLNLDKEYILASPHLCRTLASLRMSIGNALEYELAQNYGNREDVIALGVDYGFTDGEYGEYRKAFTALQTCKSALAESSTNSIAPAFSGLAISRVKKYKKLIDDLKSAVRTAMNEDVRTEMDFKKFLTKYEIICKAIGDTSLSLTCSNYVNGEVVHLLNNERMELREGVGYMVRIFNIAPNNFQAKKNLEGILQNLVIQVEETNNQSDRIALDKAVSDTGNTFKSLVNDTKIQASLSVIIDKVNSNKMKKNTALSEVYKLYQHNPDNERICENLVTLCEMCIFEYVIKDAYESAGVKNTLNSLQSNMSPTFRRKAKSLANSYNEIWGQLPPQTRMLIQGLGGFGQTLNDKGYALKAGLEYLKTLGSVKTTGGLGSIFGDPDFPF